MSINELRNLNKDMSRRRYEAEKKNELERKRKYSEFCEKSVDNKKEWEERIAEPRRNGIQRYAKYAISCAVLVLIVFLDIKLAANLLFNETKIQKKAADKLILPEPPKDLKNFVEEIGTAYLSGGANAIEQYWPKHLPPFLKESGLHKIKSADISGGIEVVSTEKNPKYPLYTVACKDAALNIITFKIFENPQNKYTLTEVY